MSEFAINTTRIDPYKNFKFRVSWDGKAVAGVSKVSSLKRTTEVVSHRTGGDPSTPYLSPGQTKIEQITLSRGVTHDREFEAWANAVFNTDGDAAVSLKNFRKNIRIELLNLQGVVVVAYDVFRAWVVSYTALPELDANGQIVAFEEIVMATEGFARDTSIVEIAET